MAAVSFAAPSRFAALRLICVLLGLAFVICATVSTGAPAPKHVLIVHSFGSAAPPFTVHSTAFQSALVEKMGESVDLDDVSLDMARYADPDTQEAIVEYLQKRHTKWQPDLVVPIGSPAAIFVAQNRERLFSETPILYTSLDRRLLPPGALEKNAAYIGQVFDVPGLLEDMLQLAPDTKNIAVMIGATPLEQYWTGTFRKATAPLADRINFIYFNDLSFDQMLSRSAKLPPHSYIFLLLLLRDATGVTYNADEALQRLHAVANAPINSIFDHQLGLGIVGGRLYQSERIGREAAEMAVRILHGEPASSLPPRLIEPLPPQYDWKELHRWKIDEKRLPAGSRILFRTPTAWQQYRRWITAGISICIAQALLISGLLMNILRRRRAEGSLAESEARFRTMADATPVLIWMSGCDKLCTFFNKAWLEFTGRTMQQELGNGWTKGVHGDDVEGCVQMYQTAFEAREPFTMRYRLRRHDGEYRFLTDTGVPRYGPRHNFRGYIGACVDVTDVLEQQKVLHALEERAAAAAEEAARKHREEVSRLSRINLLGETTASIAHELNQPLSGITSNASAAQRFIDRGNVDLAQLREILVDIVADGRRASDIIQHIRNSIKKGAALREPVNLNAVATHVARMLQPDVRMHACDLTLSLAEGLPSIEGDSIEIQQVLINLVSNAFEAMNGTAPGQRKVEIATEKNGDGTVKMSVRDHGPGISEEARQRMFEQFFTTKEEGLGMGLAIVRSIIEAHGGKISAENTDGGGARFYFVLPTTPK